MRFLLHAAKPRAGITGKESINYLLSRRAAKKSAPSNARIAPIIPHHHHPKTKNESSSPSPSPSMVAWGQQCSPDCGCVIRFETNIDPETQIIVSSTVHTRTVLRDGATNEPVLTPRRTKNVPMMTPCRCQTLNRLGRQVAEYLPHKKFHDVRNTTEFEGVRSSAAFRHVVLQNLDKGFKSEQRSKLSPKLFSTTPTTTTTNHNTMTREKCYDLVEEAFLAMVRGNVPAPRDHQIDGRMYAKHIVVMNTPLSSREPNIPNDILPSDGEAAFEDVVLGNFLESNWRNEIKFYKGGDTNSIFTTAVREEQRRAEGSTQDKIIADDWLSYVDYQEWQRDETA